MAIPGLNGPISAEDSQAPKATEPSPNTMEETMSPRTAASLTSSATTSLGMFDQLNRGSDVVRGLKKVDPSQMTHKNPDIRKQATVPPGRPVKPAGLLSPSSSMADSKTFKMPSSTKKESKLELQGNKWLIVCVCHR